MRYAISGRAPKTRKTLRMHAKKRALQRFGWELTREELQQIVRDIQQQKAVFVDRQSLRVTRWLVDVRGRRVAVAYDKMRKQICTIMPEEYVA